MDYNKQADVFLAKHGLTFRTVLVGSDCPKFCEDAEKDMDQVETFPRRSHIHGKHYRCTFSGAGRGHLSIDCWNSYADEEHNAALTWTESSCYGAEAYRMRAAARKDRKRREVTAYDVLACIEKNEVGTFEEFCGDFGYDTDSRKAEKTWRAVQAESRKVRKFFTAEELEEAQAIN